MNMFPLALLLLLFMIGGIVILAVHWMDRTPKSQFSLLSVFLWTAYVALLAAVATGEPTPDFWAVLLSPLVIGSLGVAVLGMIYRDGEQRAYWVGFAVFGFAYLATLWLMNLAPSRWLSPVGSIMLALYVPVPVIGSRIGRYFYRSQHNPPDVDPRRANASNDADLTSPRL